MKKAKTTNGAQLPNDLDNLFQDYVGEWYKEHESEFETPDEVEKLVPELYEKWKDAPCEKLGGKSPQEAVNAVDSNALIEVFISACKEGEPSDLLLERITKDTAFMPQLKQIVSGDYDIKIKLYALNMLTDQDCDGEFYIDMIDSEGAEEEVKEYCVETLCDSADKVFEVLIDHAQKAKGEAQRDRYAEILSCSTFHDTRILDYLLGLLMSGRNDAYYVSLIGRHGDERAAANLYKLADKCDYPTYLEVKNAIEMLGGTLDESLRDWTDDPSYLALKRARGRQARSLFNAYGENDEKDTAHAHENEHHCCDCCDDDDDEK